MVPITWRVLRRMEAAKDYAPGSASYREALDASIDDVHHILEIFNALLRIGQIEAGARRSAFRNVDLAAIARKVAEAFQPAAVDEGKTLDIRLDAALPLSGDEELLTQLVANLIDNAIRHTPPGSRIEVASAAEAIVSRFPSSDGPRMLTPVAFPPGRLRLATSPSLTGSPPRSNTIGMDAVAALAASADGSPPSATRTAGL